MLGRRYRRLVGSELSTLRGNALIAGRAIGWDTVSDASAGLEFDGEYTPDPAWGQRYARLLADYAMLAEGIDPLMRRLFA